MTNIDGTWHRIPKNGTCNRRSPRHRDRPRDRLELAAAGLEYRRGGGAGHLGKAPGRVEHEDQRGEVGAPARRRRLCPRRRTQDGAADAGAVEMRDGCDRVEGADAVAVERVEI